MKVKAEARSNFARERALAESHGASSRPTRDASLLQNVFSVMDQSYGALVSCRIRSTSA
jgi:hypothetical protein